MPTDLNHRLLSRDAFRAAVFARAQNACVICAAPAVDAHHIIDRQLWDDGGYYLSNGAALCSTCHIKAETTALGCDEIRTAAGIQRALLPPHLDVDGAYDKWANPILPNGQRLRGELFHLESVQKIIAPFLTLFTARVKYPRTYHLPFSPGATADDKKIDSCSQFVGREVVVTAKMDGECTTLYRDYVHARSLEYSAHPSRDRVKALHAAIAHDIPDGWRVCGENLYAQHSIAYSNLRAHFQVFSVWNDSNVCLSWKDTVEWCALLGLIHVPVQYTGVWDEPKMRLHYTNTYDGDPCEGFVVRVAEAFHYRNFRRCTAKFVREAHVKADTKHWATAAVIPNKLR